MHACIEITSRGPHLLVLLVLAHGLFSRVPMFSKNESHVSPYKPSRLVPILCPTHRRRKPWIFAAPLQYCVFHKHVGRLKLLHFYTSDLSVQEKDLS